MLTVQTTPENVFLQIPGDWSDITIQQFAKIYDILNNCKSFHKLDEIDDPFEDIEFSKSLRDALFTVTDIKSEWSKVHVLNGRKILTHFLALLTVPPEEETLKSFTHNGEQYQLPKVDLSNMTFERYMDIKTLETFVGEDGNNWKQFPGIISCLVGRYEEHMEQLFRTLPMNIAWQVFFFIKNQTKPTETSSKITTRGEEAGKMLYRITGYIHNTWNSQKPV